MSDRTIWLERVSSTQDVIHGLAADGAMDGTAVVAVAQTDGRGSRGRVWQSPRGGLWLSVLSRRDVAAPAEALSIRVALAVASTLGQLDIDGVGLKWPNDLMLGARKLGGILCEARWAGDRLGWIAIGVGLNVANEIPQDVRQPAVALRERWPELRPSDLAIPVVASVRAAASVAGPLSARERAAFATRDWLQGRTLVAPVAGLADGIEGDGALRVRRADGVVEIVRVGPAVAATF